MWKHSFIYNLNKAPGMFIIYIYNSILYYASRLHNKNLPSMCACPIFLMHVASTLLGSLLQCEVINKSFQKKTHKSWNNKPNKRVRWDFWNQRTGWWNMTLPLRQPDTNMQCLGENLQVTTMLLWERQLATSYSLTGWLGTTSQSSLHSGSNPNRRTPNPNGEQIKRPSELKHSSLMNPLATLGSSV